MLPDPIFVSHVRELTAKEFGDLIFSAMVCCESLHGQVLEPFTFEDTIEEDKKQNTVKFINFE